MTAHETLIPSLSERPIRGLGRVNLGEVTLFKEMIPFLKFAGVGAAWTVLDYAGHQVFSVTRGDRTPLGYYGNKALFSVPTLILGRLVSDLVGGAPAVRALSLATTANSAMQLRYLFGMPVDFNLVVFLLHEIILFPLSFALIGAGRRTIHDEAGYEAKTHGLIEPE